IFLSDLLSGAPPEVIVDLERRALQFAAKPPFQKLDEASRRQALAWEALIVDVFRAYQETALQEVGPEPIIDSSRMRMPEIWR
ncbi:MAG: hypothetical protein PVI60_08365, partial [Desulfobacteraceae bacterium]